MANEQKELIKNQIKAKLSLDPKGSLVDAKILKNRVFSSYEEYYYSKISAYKIDPEKKLSSIEEYRELKKEIYQWIIEDIIDNIDEWKIEAEGELTIIKHSSGKKHYQEGFGEKDWIEIKKAKNILLKYNMKKLDQEIRELTEKRELMKEELEVISLTTMQAQIEQLTPPHQ